MGFKGQYTRNGAVLTGFGAHASSIETQVREWWRSMRALSISDSNVSVSTRKNAPEAEASRAWKYLVAGAGFEPAAFRL
jgi:hypothetical protein